MEQIRTIQLGQGERYGPLHPNYRYDLRRGYTALVGPNNAGKSAVLQFVFRALYGDPEFGNQRICLILPDRNYVATSTETGGRVLATWNDELVAQIRQGPMTFASAIGPSRAELTKLLLHGNFLPQMARLNELLPRFGLPPVTLAGPQEIQFEQIVVHVQGSGLRALLPILAAVTNDYVEALLIDEPELSLEPRLQKALRDLLVETAESKRVVMVATHSHLLLNRQVLESTQIVTRSGSTTDVRTIEAERELYDLTFDLLGASTEDLFFPRNYLIVEGASDQIILERVLELLDAARARQIKVLAAQGIDEVRARVVSVVRSLVPLVVNDSPYAGHVVALVDAPRESEAANYEKLGRDLRDRLYVLDAPSVEAYIPEEVYVRSGRVKGNDLAEIDRLSGDLAARRELKKEISNAIAGTLTEPDLDAIPTIRDAAVRALDL